MEATGKLPFVMNISPIFLGRCTGLTTQRITGGSFAKLVGLATVQLEAGQELNPNAGDFVQKGAARLADLSGPPLSVVEGDRMPAIVSSNPFDLVRMQNAQVMLGQSLPVSYMPQSVLESIFAVRRSTASEPSVAATLAGLTDDEMQMLGHLDLSETTADNVLEGIAQQAPVVRLVNAMLSEAHRRGASDIHLEPTPKVVSLRYRIDGVLYDQPAPPRQLYPAIISRIKILAGLNIAEKRLPQDGRIRMNLVDHELDVRVATIPSIYGESAALRLLDKGTGVRTLSELGMSQYDRDRLGRVFGQTHGIVLVTGPTGSGKTTTLYAMLQEIRSPERKILTLEDPVEYEIAGVTQIQVKPKIGFTFAAGLRSLLRHDPDVLLVGEIRDLETAEMATHASLTGHLVLSSLHTNDAPTALTRLVDMGIEPFLITSTVRAVVAQRLVRILCNACRRPTGDSTSPYEAAGCPECDGTGYRGRTAVCEVMICEDAVSSCLLAGESTSGVKRVARSQGMRSIREDGMEKVRQGLTTLDEVVRVAGWDD